MVDEKDWRRYRVMWEASLSNSYPSFEDIAALAGVTLQAVQQRATREGWRKLEEDEPDAQELSAMATTVPPARQEAPGISVDPKDQVIQRHRKEWGLVQHLLIGGMNGDRTRFKDAERVARTLKILQEEERRVWGIGLGDLVEFTIAREDYTLVRD